MILENKKKQKRVAVNFTISDYLLIKEIAEENEITLSETVRILALKEVDKCIK